MAQAPLQHQILIAVQPRSFEKREGGEIVLTWSTSYQRQRSIKVMADEFQNITIVEPGTRSETKTYDDDTELRNAVERYKAGLGKSALEIAVT